MRVYRISKADYVAVALSGQGAAQAPGRWNSQGTRLAYTAASVALAMLEILVHLDRQDVPSDRRLLTFEVPDDAIEELTDLPEGWNGLPYTPDVQEVGDVWIESASSLALQVPSAVARHEVNIFINPGHRRFSEITLVADESLALDDNKNCFSR